MNEPERVPAKQRCAKFRFIDLPLEIVVLILSGLRIRDCSRFARTCKPMNQPFNDGEFWKVKTTADWVHALQGVSFESNWALLYRLLATNSHEDLRPRQQFHTQLQKHAKSLRDLVHSNLSYMPLKRDACMTAVRTLLNDSSPMARERVAQGYLQHLFLSFLARASPLSYEQLKSLVEVYVNAGGMLNLPVNVLTRSYHLSFDNGERFYYSSLILPLAYLFSSNITKNFDESLFTLQNDTLSKTHLLLVAKILIECGADPTAWSFLEAVECEMRRAEPPDTREIIAILAQKKYRAAAFVSCCFQRCSYVLEALIVECEGVLDFEWTYKGFSLISLVLAPVNLTKKALVYSNRKLRLTPEAALENDFQDSRTLDTLRALLKAGGANNPDAHGVTPKEWLRFRSLLVNPEKKNSYSHFPLSQQYKDIIVLLKPMRGDFAISHRPKYFCKDCRCIYSDKEEICRFELVNLEEVISPEKEYVINMRHYRRTVTVRRGKVMVSKDGKTQSVPMLHRPDVGKLHYV